MGTQTSVSYSKDSVTWEFRESADNKEDQKLVQVQIIEEMKVQS